ncbi:MAG: D-alanyl-D-alanine carboxypeptidase family protein [Micrococcales bacterium]
MFQPKRQKPTTEDNRRAAGIISLFLAFFALTSVPAALAETPTPTPTATPTITATPSPTPTAIPDPPGFTEPSIDEAGSIWVVVNKKRPLNPIRYKPVLDKSVNLAKPAADAFRALKAAVSKAKMGTLCLNSGYRSYNTQSYTYNLQLKRYGKKVAENLAAHPGYSEHQTGLAADVSTTALSCRITNFGKSATSKWISNNAWQYGFIVRYPDGETATTGYQYEPWHLRFVGIELATKMHDQKITVLEKFWNLPAAKSY